MMNNTSIIQSKRADTIIEKIEDVFLTIFGIAIGLSPFLVFVR